MKGVDVSYANGVIDWNALRTAGIEFAIVRTGAGIDIEDSFQWNVTGAHEAGIICGAYHYSYAMTAARAIAEARFCRSIIDESGVMLELPVFFDMEDADGYKARRGFDFSRVHVTGLCRAFVENIGLNAGVYASYDWLERLIDWRELGCPVWNAQWSGRDDLQGMMWQFTDGLWIGGKRFDGNILYDEKSPAGCNPWA